MKRYKKINEDKIIFVVKTKTSMGNIVGKIVKVYLNEIKKANIIEEYFFGYIGLDAEDKAMSLAIKKFFKKFDDNNISS